jgi:multidrug efflux pump subunit AcrA (membrane-fusion protein)
MKKIPTLILLTLALLLTACGAKTETPVSNLTPAAATVIAEGHLYPTQNLFLVFPAAGRVAEVLVSAGDRVNKGDVLVRLGDSQQAEAALATATLQLTLAQQDYDSLVRTADLGHAQAWQAYISAQKSRAAAQLAWDKLDLNTIQTDIDNAQADVTTRQTELDDAQTELDKYIDLPTDNATRKSNEDKLRTAQTNYDTAVQKLEDITNRRDSVRTALDAAINAESEAKRAYENTQDGPDTDKLALAQARLDAAQAQANAAQAAVDNYELTAPFSGIVEDVNVEVGEWSGPDSYAVALADTSVWYVDTSDLTELDVVNISVGQTVEVTADALPDVVMTGVIESISGAPKVQGGDILYTVRIHMNEVDPAIRWGMTVEVTVKPGQ